MRASGILDNHEIAGTGICPKTSPPTASRRLVFPDEFLDKPSSVKIVTLDYTTRYIEKGTNVRTRFLVRAIDFCQLIR